MTLSAVRVSPKTDWTRLVHALEGASAADVVKVARNAAKSAVLRGKKVVGETELCEVIREVTRKQNDDA
jgi:ATP-dependent 26S proteasome regulatory subunit